MIIIAGNDGQFKKLCAALGVPELGVDERFERNVDRTRNRDVLRPMLVEQLAKRTADEWFRVLTDAGVVCGPINHVDGGVALAESLGLDPVVLVGDGADAVPSIRNPIRFGATPAHPVLPPPRLDQHGDEIREWLAKPLATEGDA
jgi:crotonobetainyl-CoA:carnitine CoA-transferase CaiB-like acyl-CoA transferase